MRLIKSDKFNIQTKQDNVIFPTLINSYSRIAGDISLTTDVRIDGTVYGVIETEKNIYIGRDGYAKGVLRAKNLVCFGRIEGSVIISGISIFHPESSFFGTLFTKDISVLYGASISAHIVTFDVLDPIYEAQICLEEEKTRAYSNRARGSLPLNPNDENDPLKKIISPNHIEDNEPVKQKKKIAKAEIANYGNSQYVTNRESNGSAHQIEEIDLNSVQEKISRQKHSEVPIKKEKNGNPTVKEIVHEKRKVEKDLVLDAMKSDSDYQPKPVEVNSKIDPKSDNSFIFESLLKNSSVDKSDTLLSEVEKLNLASMEFGHNKESQLEEKSFFDRLFQSKSKSSSQ